MGQRVITAHLAHLYNFKDPNMVVDIDPKTISYIKAYGTGTQIDNSIELRALTRVMGERIVRNQPPKTKVTTTRKTILCVFLHLTKISHMGE